MIPNNISDQLVGAILTYRFGKTIKDQRHHDANGAQSEMNRVGN